MGLPQYLHYFCVPVPREAPVLGTFQPVVEPLLLRERGHPVRLLVVADQVLLDGGHADEPRVVGLVDQRRVGAPAKRVAVVNLRLQNKPVVLLQHLLNLRVCVLHVQACEVSHGRQETPVHIQRADRVACN